MIEAAFTSIQMLGGGALMGLASVLLMASMARGDFAAKPLQAAVPNRA